MRLGKWFCKIMHNWKHIQPTELGLGGEYKICKRCGLLRKLDWAGGGPCIITEEEDIPIEEVLILKGINRENLI